MSPRIKLFRGLSCSLMVLIALTAVADAEQPATGGPPNKWQGQKIFPKAGRLPKLKNTETNLSKIGFPFVVEKVEGDRLIIGRGQASFLASDSSRSRMPRHTTPSSSSAIRRTFPCMPTGRMYGLKRANWIKRLPISMLSSDSRPMRSAFTAEVPYG